MPLPSSGQISMKDIVDEKKGNTNAVDDVSLQGLSVDGTSLNPYYDYKLNGVGVDITGTPNGNFPYAMSEFHGYSSTFATTHYNSFSLDSFSSDSNIDVRARLRAFYSSGDIIVKLSGSADNFSPALNTTMFSITNAPSGYTVRRGTFSHNFEIPTITGTIASSATSIPTTPFAIYVDMEGESGGGFDDAGSFFATGSGSLIFEKSGSTTYTYSFSYSLEAETEGSGGE